LGNPSAVAADLRFGGLHRDRNSADCCGKSPRSVLVGNYQPQEKIQSEFVIFVMAITAR